METTENIIQSEKDNGVCSHLHKLSWCGMNYGDNEDRLCLCPSPVDDRCIKLGPCEVCNHCTAKYTCPKCEVKTCSLKCNKIHKFELECDGQRDKAKFIPVNKFTNLDLLNDYKFLEEGSRVAEVSRKRKLTRTSFIPNHLFRLQRQAASEQITLQFLPRNFARRKANTTRCDFSTKLIEWHLDVVFVNAEGWRVALERVVETTKISTILDRCLATQDESTDEGLSKLQYYQAAGLPGCRLFLKAERKCGIKFYELDAGLTLRESLKNKVIIENPLIHVVLKEHSSCYDVIDSDEELVDNETVDVKTYKKHGDFVINNIIRNAEKSENVGKKLKNLMFVDDCSTDESSADESGSKKNH